MSTTMSMRWTVKLVHFIQSVRRVLSKICFGITLLYLIIYVRQHYSLALALALTLPFSFPSSAVYHSYFVRTKYS